MGVYKKLRLAGILAAGAVFCSTMAACGNTAVSTTSVAESQSVQAESESTDANSSETLDVTTIDVDTVTAEGQYYFTWSGGSGRARIVCDEVRIDADGQIYAEITYENVNGRTAAFDMVRVEENVYAGSNTFLIPVRLNQTMGIEGRTTAMSTPHWISYQIYVGDGSVGAAKNTLAENMEALDEEAPDITGLTFESETEVTYSDKIKIFHYDQGISLIEIAMSTDTVGEEEADTENTDTLSESTLVEETANFDSENAAEDTAADSNVINTVSADGEAVSADEAKAALYQNAVIKYLILPENVEIPAGADTEAVVIRQPCDRTFLASESAMDILEQLEVLDHVTALGVAEDAVTSELLMRDDVVSAGTYDDWDLKALVTASCNLAIESSEILSVSAADDAEEGAEQNLLQTYAERAVQLELPILIDRSAEEENELAAAEWYKVYGVIYGVEEVYYAS